MLQQILERKNSEIEETKSVFRAKQKESEETIRKLERKGEGLKFQKQKCERTFRKGNFIKNMLLGLAIYNMCVDPAVQCALQESEVIRETKEKQIAELRKMLEHSADSLTNECEKKV